MTVYENYDSIMLKSVNEQYFAISVTNRAGEEVEVTLPTLVVEKGMKWYKENFVTVTLPKENTPPAPKIRPARVPLGFKKLDPRAIMPRYAHVGDAGMDVFALDDVTLPLNAPTMVHTGIAAEIPEGYEIQVRARSGLATKGVTVWNAPGTVDSKYRGEICVILMFISNRLVVTSDNEDPHVNSYQIQSGDRIAQLVLAPVTEAEPYEVQELSTTDRGTGGFGSTGR